MDYSGKDNLEVMEEAKNYNTYLLDMLRDCVQDKHHVILDFGAGTGFFAKQVKNLFPSKDIIALEPAENLEEYYQDKQVKKVSSLRECSAVDLIYSFNVLEHIEDDVSILRDLYSVLPMDGKLCLYVPAFPCLYSVMDKKVGHYRRYTKQELKSKVEKAGFKVKVCQYKDIVGFWGSMVYKFCGPKDGSINLKSLMFYDKIIMPLSIWLDKLTGGKLFGKNLWLVAEK